jgi:hypothetical protein
MEGVKQSLSEMMALFNARMSSFEADLHKTPSAAGTGTSSLASEFALFKAFIMESVKALQNQVELLAHNVDRVEMQGRRKILLLHDVPEVKSEDLSATVSQFCRDRLKVDLFNHIKLCHRMGRSSDPQKPRPILVKLNT